jgi:hypothetical protein
MHKISFPLSIQSEGISKAQPIIVNNSIADMMFENDGKNERENHQWHEKPSYALSLNHSTP